MTVSSQTLTFAAREVVCYAPAIREIKFREELSRRKVNYDEVRPLANHILNRVVADFERSFERFVRPARSMGCPLGRLHS